MKQKKKINSAKAPGNIRALVIAACVTLAIALGCGIFWYRSDSQAEGVKLAGDQPAPNGPSITLDPKQFEGPARDAYRIARERPDLLVNFHCYCGCDRTLGHRNLLDCYRDRHAASCAICIGEARDSYDMSERGSTVDQIKDTLRARYEHQE
jgi:hypothetical protein